ncbi:MAG TPA: ABC transporter ATP-binding protein [Candidatus Binataceae bacterium]|nr:ABC transporter ATP-binding protein [Candidatus Binataceae bacterium]
MAFFTEPEFGRAYDWRLIKWVWGYVRPYRRLFWLSVILMPLNSGFALAQPYIFKLTVDIFLARAKILPPHWLRPLLAIAHGHSLIAMGVLYLLLLLGEVTTFYGQFYLTMMVAQYSLSDLRLDLFRHVQRLPMAFYDRTPVGRLVSRMTTDIDAINEMFSAGSLTLFIDFLTLTGIVVIMFVFNPRLAAWSLCAVPPLLIVINFFRVRMRNVFREIRERLAALNAYLSEALSGMSVVQIFAHEQESRREFNQLNQDNREVQRTSNNYDACLYSTVEALSSITIAIVLWIGGGEVIQREMSLGTLVAFIFYAQLFFNPLRDVSSKYTTLQSALAAVERIEALMATPASIASPPQPKRTTGGLGAIVFEHVSFEYRRGEPVLRDLSFKVSHGEKIAIVGPTGSGKTTIIKLLNRFYDVTSGRIVVDGVDVREWDLSELRRAIGLVQQDVFLFAEDVFENVRLARTELAEREIREALSRAQALRFVERLPQGLREQIHERGANLSAGQRQLLSFARALAYDPRILVMDEATSSVDSETERLIQLALNELLSDRTALIIAHRLSTIERADRILVLSNGVLRESGTHEELLRRPGLYRRLFELQYAGAESAREAVD